MLHTRLRGRSRIFFTVDLLAMEEEEELSPSPKCTGNGARQ